MAPIGEFTGKYRNGTHKQLHTLKQGDTVTNKKLCCTVLYYGRLLIYTNNNEYTKHAGR